MTDAAIVGQHCATVLMLSQAQKDSISEVNSAIEVLQQAGIRIKGHVLNALLNGVHYLKSVV